MISGIALLPDGSNSLCRKGIILRQGESGNPQSWPGWRILRLIRGAEKEALGKPDLYRGNAFLDGVFDQVGEITDFQFLHQLGAMGFHGLYTDK